MTEQQREAMEGQRKVPGDPGALKRPGWANVEDLMKNLPMAPTRREELCLKIRMTALAAAAQTTVDMDAEVTIRTADKFVRWICEGV